MGAIFDYFSKTADRGNSLFPFAENYKACLIKARELRQQQFLECLGAKMEGRGVEAKIFVEDLERFQTLESERLALVDRSAGIVKMFERLDAIITKATSQGIQLRTPTPDSLRGGGPQRRNEIYQLKRDLSARAAKRMAVDSFETPSAEPGNLAEIMSEEIKYVKTECERLEKEAQILDALYKECARVVLDGRHLLQPPTEPEEVREDYEHPFGFDVEPRVAPVPHLFTRERVRWQGGNDPAALFLFS